MSEAAAIRDLFATAHDHLDKLEDDLWWKSNRPVPDDVVKQVRLMRETITIGLQLSELLNIQVDRLSVTPAPPADPAQLALFGDNLAIKQ
jgi:hypothetical protein